MTKYAAIDHLAIYAVGDTPAAAIANARREVRDDEAAFDTARISAIDAATIETRGFNGHSDGFDVENGTIVLHLARG